MSVAVVGCGRSGTNLVLEILSGNSKLKPSKEVENKKLFRNGKYPSDYLTKCDTVYFNAKDFERTMEQNPELLIVWTIRDPRDMILSKIKRGQPKSKGGDGSEKIAGDATPKGCLEDLKRMFDLHKFAFKNYKDRLMWVRMEDIINDIERWSKRMCAFIDIPYEEQMSKPMSRMRNKDKVKRYKGLDKSQIGLWKNYKEIYNGFFAKNEYPIEKLFKDVEYLIDYFGYEK